MSEAMVWTFVALIWVLIGRNHLVYKMRTRRLSEIHEYNMARINAKNFNVSEHDRLMSLYDDVSEENYLGQVFDLTRWKYRQFYPKPVE